MSKKSGFLLVLIMLSLGLIFQNCGSEKSETFRLTQKVEVENSIGPEYNQSLDQFGFSDSGYRYSELVGMFERRASQQSSGGIIAWANIGEQATVYFSTENKYYEVFRKSGEWITLDGWGNTFVNEKTGKLSDAYYQIYTTRVVVINNGNQFDITSDFFGKGQAYALEKIPDSNYQLYIEATLVEYKDWKRSDNELKFSWYVDWGHPEIRPSLLLGEKIGIMQSEQWIDSRGGNSRQVQNICEGAGYACWRLGASGSSDGTQLVWTW